VEKMVAHLGLHARRLVIGIIILAIF